MVPVVPATGALVTISAVPSRQTVGLLGIAILNQESNHVQVRRCHRSLLGRSGIVLGHRASSLLPPVLRLCTRANMLRPCADLLRPGRDECCPRSSGTRFCTAAGPVGKHQPGRTLARHVAERRRTTDVSQLFL